MTTPLPGAREIIVSAAQGRLVEREPAAIAEAVRAILADPPDRLEVAAGVAEFSWEANAAALIAHWRRLATR